VNVIRTECLLVSRRLRWLAVHSKLGTGNALALDAQLTALEGNREEARTKARLAREYCESCSHVLLARSMEYLEGVLEGNEGGASRRNSALAFFADQGWKIPRRAVAMLCPVLDELEA
jgi:hypothetical protein